jgi:hypothetical protein
MRNPITLATDTQVTHYSEMPDIHMVVHACDRMLHGKVGIVHRINNLDYLAFHMLYIRLR